jgi:hypothetical protein
MCIYRPTYAHACMSLSHDTASRSGYVKPWRDGLGETPVAHGRQFHSYSNSRPALDLSSHEGRLLSFLSLVQVFTRRQFKSRISGQFYTPRRRRVLSLSCASAGGHAHHITHIQWLNKTDNEDSNLLRCYAVSTGKYLPMFGRDAVFYFRGQEESYQLPWHDVTEELAL